MQNNYIYKKFCFWPEFVKVECFQICFDFRTTSECKTQRFPHNIVPTWLPPA